MPAATLGTDPPTRGQLAAEPEKDTKGEGKLEVEELCIWEKKHWPQMKGSVRGSEKRCEWNEGYGVGRE